MASVPGLAPARVLSLPLILAVAACRSPGEPSPSEATPAPAPSTDGSAGGTDTAEELEASAPPAVEATPVAAAAATDWCIEGLTALEDDVCYVLPPLPADRPRRLLVYLHGMLPPTPGFPQKRGFEAAVLEASRRAGVAAMIPRGRPGIGPSFARDWWAWPTHAEDLVRFTSSIVDGWAAAKAKLERIAGAPFERTYLAGSSNGAYFLTALVLRGAVPTERFPVDGFGAMSGGGATERLLAPSPRPVYVGYGLYDETSVNNARPLVAALRGSGWTVRVSEHPLAHGANAVYVDEALAFWDGAHGDVNVIDVAK